MIDKELGLKISTNIPVSMDGYMPMCGMDGYMPASGYDDLNAAGLLKRIFAPKQVVKEQGDDLYARLMAQNPPGSYKTAAEVQARIDSLSSELAGWNKKANLGGAKDAAEKRVAARNYQALGNYISALRQRKADILRSDANAQKMATPTPTMATSKSGSGSQARNTPGTGSMPSGGGASPANVASPGGGIGSMPGTDENTGNTSKAAFSTKNLKTAGIVAGFALVGYVLYKIVKKK